MFLIIILIDFVKVFQSLSVHINWRFNMARIIEGERRIIKMSVDERKEIIKNNIEQVKKFNWDLCGSKTIDILTNINKYIGK